MIDFTPLVIPAIVGLITLAMLWLFGVPALVGWLFYLADSPYHGEIRNLAYIVWLFINASIFVAAYFTGKS